jgi:heme exporter protein CcmD
MGHDSHIGFIVAAYAVAAVVIGTMIIALLSEYRTLRRQLQRFGERGIDRE